MTRAKLNVAMWPRMHPLNPYTETLAADVERFDVNVSEFAWDRRTFRSDIVHLHWPNEFFYAPGIRLKIQTWKRLVWLAAFRAKGGRIVWTVHNTWPHDKPKKYSLRLRAFLALLNGVVFLTHASKGIVCAEHPALAGKMSAVIPLMTYGIFSGPSTKKSYTHGRSLQLGYFGLIRPYKQLDRLIRCMKEISPAEASLTISGTSVGYTDLEQQLKELTQNASNIELSFAFRTNGQLEQFVDECDAVILPYQSILNSGAAIFALSRLRPVMVPGLGSMLELREIVGRDWVFCYSGDLTSKAIQEFVSWVKQAPRTKLPDMSSFDPGVVAESTARLYQLLSTQNESLARFRAASAHAVDDLKLD